MFGSSCFCVQAASLWSSLCNRWGCPHFPHSSVQSSKSTCSAYLFFRSSPDKFFSSRTSNFFILDLCSSWLTSSRVRSGTWSLALQMTILHDVTPTKGSLYFITSLSFQEGSGYLLFLLLYLTWLQSTLYLNPEGSPCPHQSLRWERFLLMTWPWIASLSNQLFNLALPKFSPFISWWVPVLY